MKNLAKLITLVIFLTFVLGCSGGSDGDAKKDPELKGKVESTEIKSAPGDIREGGGEKEGN